MIADINILQTSANHITHEDIMFEKRQSKNSQYQSIVQEVYLRYLQY